MPSPIHECVINAFVRLPIRIGPYILVNLKAREHCALNNQLFFLCGRVYCSNTIFITNLM
jgi:hypothetical protein